MAQTVLWIVQNEGAVSVFEIPADTFDGVRLPTLERFQTIVHMNNRHGDIQADWDDPNNEAACQLHWHPATCFYMEKILNHNLCTNHISGAQLTGNWANVHVVVTSY